MEVIAAGRPDGKRPDKRDLTRPAAIVAIVALAIAWLATERPRQNQQPITSRTVTFVPGELHDLAMMRLPAVPGLKARGWRAVRQEPVTAPLRLSPGDYIIDLTCVGQG